ncbi:hypothetical protein sync_2242 [Synechococcus sp. CC9311]|nr:hypothetical protein sync_2242 [Synechococcus sp. CC9311]
MVDVIKVVILIYLSACFSDDGCHQNLLAEVVLS